jgi:multicomponent Na+:H+ antiporter subunit E
MAVVMRWAAFFVLWLVIAGSSVDDLMAGLAVAAIAAWTSLRLLPPTGRRASPLAVFHLALRLLWQSLPAGWDVARRALDPRLPLRPGLVVYRARIAPGPARSMFCLLESLLPGTLLAGSDATGALVVHCLDVEGPVLAQMAADEELLARALGAGHG